MCSFKQNQQKAESGSQLQGGLLKGLVAFLKRSLHCGRVGKTPVNAFRVAWEGGTRLAHAITDGHDDIKGLPDKLIEGLGS